MFDYRLMRNPEEYAAKLRREALDERLVRSVSPRLADTAARVFRAWAARLEQSGAKRPDASYGAWRLDQERYEAITRNRRHPYAGSKI